ncbi:MAG: protein translocase subunit SecF [Pseudomonadota bacterium]
MKALKIVPDDTNINFIGARYIAFVFSAILLLGSIGLTVKNGLNFGIDFVGGTMIEIRVPVEQPDLADLRARLNTLELGGVSIQEFGQPDDLLIRLPEQVETPEEMAAREECMDKFNNVGQCPTAQSVAVEKVRAELEAAYPDDEVDYRRVEFVGPQVGEELKQQGMYAILFSLLGILAYIWFRFEWQFGVAAIVALAHDAIATIGLFALTQMEFNLSTVAAVLMIAGYSINDTVVVFDRIRENLQKFKKKPLTELFNLSVNQMLSRTLMTSVTTLLALFALWYFGGEVIRGFVNALIFGIAIGTYSSIFVAAPILLFMNIRKKAATPKESEGEPAKA